MFLMCSILPSFGGIVLFAWCMSSFYSMIEISCCDLVLMVFLAPVLRQRLCTDAKISVFEIICSETVLVSMRINFSGFML